MEQIVKLIIPIIAFIIVVGWLMYVGLQDLKKDDICHASVLGRAQTKSLGEVAPLKCEVNKFCVSDSNGKCEEVFVGEKINKISLSSKETEALDTTQRLIAERMYRCWKVMGEGKLDLFGNFGTSIGWDSAKPLCVICSRIAYDFKDNTAKERLFRNMNLEKYLAENIPIDEEDITYTQAFLNDPNFPAGYVVPSPESLEEQEELYRELQSSGAELIDLTSKDDMAVVFMQIKTPKYSDALKKIGEISAGVSASSFMLPVIGSGIGPGGAVLGAKASAVVTISALALGTAQSVNAYFKVKEGRSAAAGY